MSSLVTAVEEKFTDMQNAHGIFISGSPGVNDCGKLVLPTILCMDDRQIARAGDEERLRELLKDVVELDLMKNHLATWEDLLTILRATPSLQSLNLSFNPLVTAGPGPLWAEEERHRFPKLCTIALNSTSLSWEQLLALLPAFPQLSELHIGMNALACVPKGLGVQFPSLRHLYFNANRLEHFEHLIRLNRLFPGLEQLVVIKNGLHSIDTAVSEALEAASSGTEDEDDPFPHLTYLNLAENCLSRWDCIDQLRQLPALVDLRMAGNPLLETMPVKESRMHVIARLPDLVRLNGSPIGEEERIDAERAFIRAFMDLEEKPRRYHELVEKYGRLDPLAKVDLRPQSVINFVVRYDENPTSELRPINVDQSVGDLKKEVCAIFGLKPSQGRLIYVDTEIDCHEELCYNRRMMHSYRPSDGDELRLFPK